MFKKVLALVLGLSMMLSIAACGKKVEVPSKSDVKKAAAALHAVRRLKYLQRATLRRLLLKSMTWTSR